MRKPKVRREDGEDCFLAEFRSHTTARRGAPPDPPRWEYRVTVLVTEVDSGPDAGSLVVQLANVEGKVRFVCAEIDADLGMTRAARVGLTEPRPNPGPSPRTREAREADAGGDAAKKFDEKETKVMRLVRLASSDNENEARNAAFEACRLIREYGLVVSAKVKARTSSPWEGL